MYVNFGYYTFDTVNRLTIANAVLGSLPRGKDKIPFVNIRNIKRSKLDSAVLVKVTLRREIALEAFGTGQGIRL